MKNAIKFYYNIDVDSLKQVSDKFVFYSSNSVFVFETVSDNKLSDYIYLLDSHYHSIIKNINNDIFTIINGLNYILLKVNSLIQSIKYSDLFYTVFYGYLDVGDRLKVLWEKRVDYTEYLVSQFGIKYSILRRSFSYYDGLTETAIQLLGFVGKSIPVYLQHYRIKKDLSTIDYYDPLKIIIDSRVRDISEYLKDCFFKGFDIYNMCVSYIDTLSFDEVILFIARMIYPSYYYDLFDDIINSSISEDKINDILDKTILYEDIIKSIYFYARKKYMLPKVDWF